MRHIARAALRRHNVRSRVPGGPAGKIFLLSTMQSSYFICATPRSGSTLLCELLMLTGVAGYPSEWMLPLAEPLAQEMFAIEVGFEDRRYFSELTAKGCSGNGVFATKLMWPAMQQLLAGELWGLPAGKMPFREAGIFPNLRYVHIVRNDELRQAISMLLAVRTDYWQRMAAEPTTRSRSRWAEAMLRADARMHHARIQTDGAASRWSAEQIVRELEDAARRAQLILEIDNYRAMIRQQEHAWATFFRAERATPFVVRYEDLVADPATVLRDVLQNLRLPADEVPDLDALRLRPLADARNALLYDAYAAEREALVAAVDRDRAPIG
jgi:trehalose 2-sulfotransferase